MASNGYLKNAPTDVIVAAVKQYGSLAFIGEGLTPMDVASCAAQAITEQDKLNFELETFFISTTRNDSSYEKITYRVEDVNPAVAMVYLEKVVEYKPARGMAPRAPKITRGPMLPRAIASAFVQAVNQLQAEYDAPLPA